MAAKPQSADPALATRGGAVIGLYNLINLEVEWLGLTMWQLQILAFCVFHPTTPSELASWQKVKRQSVTRHLKGLVDRGLLSRGADPADRRRLVHAITDDGMRALCSVSSNMDKTIGLVLAELPDRRARTADVGLLAVGEALDRLWFGGQGRAADDG